MDAVDRVSHEALLNVDLNVIVVLPERSLRKKKHGSGKKKAQSHIDRLLRFDVAKGQEVARIYLTVLYAKSVDSLKTGFSETTTRYRANLPISRFSGITQNYEIQVQNVHKL